LCRCLPTFRRRNRLGCSGTSSWIVLRIARSFPARLRSLACRSGPIRNSKTPMPLSPRPVALPRIGEQACQSFRFGAPQDRSSDGSAPDGLRQALSDQNDIRRTPELGQMGPFGYDPGDVSGPDPEFLLEPTADPQGGGLAERANPDLRADQGTRVCDRRTR